MLSICVSFTLYFLLAKASSSTVYNWELSKKPGWPTIISQLLSFINHHIISRHLLVIIYLIRRVDIISRTCSPSATPDVFIIFILITNKLNYFPVFLYVIYYILSNHKIGILLLAYNINTIFKQHYSHIN